MQISIHWRAGSTNTCTVKPLKINVGFPVIKLGDRFRIWQRFLHSYIMYFHAVRFRETLIRMI